MRMEQIYQEVILDHYKHPHHRGLREPFGAEVHHVNPTCGDEVTLRVALTDDGERSPTFRTTGRAVRSARPSTSVLTDQVIGQTVGDALETVAASSRWFRRAAPSKVTRTCSATASRSPVCRSTRHA